MEHIISIPKGDNSYKNIAASCRTCNNKKSDKAADEFLRILYRSNILSQDELEERLTRIEEIQAGKHVPVLEP
jgi:5-methylcytosine-specific restriction endonuclease McrA